MDEPAEGQAGLEDSVLGSQGLPWHSSHILLKGTW